MDENSGELKCSVTYEQLSPTGEVLKKTVYRNAFLSLGRNQFRDIILKMELGKQVHRFMPRDIQVFKRFAKEGKATIKLVKQKIQFLLSNCPPHNLMVFLKTLTIKVECMLHKGVLSDRKRLFSEAAPSYEDISPLTMKDVNTVNESRAKQAEKNCDFFTPKGKRQKIGTDDKENLLLKV